MWEGARTFIIADDHPVVRQGVRLVLELEIPGCRVTEASDLDAALEALAASPAALLLIDLDMPGMEGIESLRALRQGFPSVVMAVLSGNTDSSVITAALMAGMNGYILKASSAQELLYAIATVSSGHIYVANLLTHLTSEAVVTARPVGTVTQDLAENGGAMLTPRQREVTVCLMRGQSNKEIARALRIGEGTVKIHMAAIFRALGAKNRTEAVATASRLGL